MRRLSIFVALLIVPFIATSTRAQAPADKTKQELEQVMAKYTKYEYKIPMRDGKKLFTSVYVPKDTTQTYPILLTRTPYTCRPYGVDQYRHNVGPSAHFVKSGYIFAIQDVRGRWMSEGDFVNVRPHNPEKKAQEIDESSDTYDTIEFLLKKVQGNNGKVGLWGISYPGFYTAAGMIAAHPALKAASPQAPVIDWFVGDDWHHNGALFLPHIFNYMVNFGKPRPEPTRKDKQKFDHDTPDGYDFFLKMGPLSNADAKYMKGDVAFWNEVMKHGTYDEFWKARNLRPHLKDIKPAVLVVGGWFDAENLFGAIETYKRVKATSPKTPNTLVMGPWLHGGWNSQDGDKLGFVHFNDKTSLFYREKIEFPFFEEHLKGKGKFAAPAAWVFETGRNQWRTYDAWPPKSAKQVSYFFHPRGKLLTEAPAENGDESFDEYISDPAKPVPYMDKTTIGMSAEYMVADQRHAARRPDVVVYETEPLEEDVTIAGPIRADLRVSTTGTDSDWVVKVIDVYPSDYPDPKPNPADVRMGGFQQLVRGDVMRGKFRNSYERPEAFDPGKPTTVAFDVPDTFHTFRAGHKIMIQVQSTWFPLVDRNPQTFCDIYAAKETDFKKATQRVHRGKTLPSSVKFTVLP